jgi:hypothetical protein
LGLDSSFRWNDGELGHRTTVCHPGGGWWVGEELVQALALKCLEGRELGSSFPWNDGGESTTSVWLGAEIPVWLLAWSVRRGAGLDSSFGWNGGWGTGRGLARLQFALPRFPS